MIPTARTVAGALSAQPTAAEAAARFEAWFGYHDEAKREFVDSLPADVRVATDGSVASLDLLERWLLSRFDSLEATRTESAAPIINGAVRYFGDILRQATGSEWGVELKDRDFAFFGLPVLRGGNMGPRGDCPLSMITAATDRRTGGYLAKIVQVRANR